MKTRVICEIEGVTPLMTHRMTEEEIENLVPGAKKRKAQAEPLSPSEQAKLRIYTDDKGNPIIPMANLMAWLIDAGRHIKIGKNQLSTRTDSMVPGLLTIVSGDAKIVSKAGWEVDIRRAVNQATKAAVRAVRPRWDDWKLRLELEVNTDRVSMQTIRELVETSCEIIGLASYRPAKRGWFGKAQIIKWDVKNPPTKSVEGHQATNGKVGQKASKKKVRKEPVAVN